MQFPFSSGFVDDNFSNVSSILLLNDILFFAFNLSNLVCSFYRNNFDKMEALENLDLILLCLDEIVDGG